MRPRTLQISFFVLLFTVCASWRAHADIIIAPTATPAIPGELPLVEGCVGCQLLGLEVG